MHVVPLQEGAALSAIAAFPIDKENAGCLEWLLICCQPSCLVFYLCLACGLLSLLVLYMSLQDRAACSKQLGILVWQWHGRATAIPVNKAIAAFRESPHVATSCARLAR